jgi:uncharacterized protein YbjQ (UPF0145 family)
LYLLFFLCAVALLLGGCATWSQANVDRPAAAETAAADPVETDPAKIILTEKDITDRKYKVLGDIEVMVNKTTLFHPDPTRQMVRDELRAEASKLGADAVVLVRYGTLGVTGFSWGSLDSRGRAVRFVN